MAFDTSPFSTSVTITGEPTINVEKPGLFGLATAAPLRTSFTTPLIPGSTAQAPTGDSPVIQALKKRNVIDDGGDSDPSGPSGPTITVDEVFGQKETGFFPDETGKMVERDLNFLDKIQGFSLEEQTNALVNEIQSYTGPLTDEQKKKGQPFGLATEHSPGQKQFEFVAGIFSTVAGLISIGYNNVEINDALAEHIGVAPSEGFFGTIAAAFGYGAATEGANLAGLMSNELAPSGYKDAINMVAQPDVYAKLGMTSWGPGHIETRGLPSADRADITQEERESYAAQRGFSSVAAMDFADRDAKASPWGGFNVGTAIPTSVLGRGNTLTATKDAIETILSGGMLGFDHGAEVTERTNQFGLQGYEVGASFNKDGWAIDQGGFFTQKADADRYAANRAGTPTPTTPTPDRSINPLQVSPADYPPDYWSGRGRTLKETYDPSKVPSQAGWDGPSPSDLGFSRTSVSKAAASEDIDYGPVSPGHQWKGPPDPDPWTSGDSSDDDGGLGTPGASAEGAGTPF